MGHYKVKNLKINKKEYVISGYIADSNLTTYDNKYIFNYCKDLYPNEDDFQTKYIMLLCDIIKGNLQPTGGKYKKLICTFDIFKDFTSLCNNKEYIKAYNLYEDKINNYLNPKVLDCYIKRKYTNLYIKKINRKTIELTWNINLACKFNSEIYGTDNKKNWLDMNNLELINTNEVQTNV